ncbi:EGF-like domain protein [Teladorsagia circumcincta]|uniref:Delta-like protein n=1 Tax=Teladorsagia circumcincta TaxID=45464 RepID=A0A2G9UTW0_TELCI|nr:EGF-like domain protein [Teladorsagia circumcincta]
MEKHDGETTRRTTKHYKSVDNMLIRTTFREKDMKTTNPKKSGGDFRNVETWGVNKKISFSSSDDLYARASLWVSEEILAFGTSDGHTWPPSVKFFKKEQSQKFIFQGDRCQPIQRLAFEYEICRLFIRSLQTAVIPHQYVSVNSSCSCDVQLSFCAGVRFPDKKHYKDCHYIHFQTPFLSNGDFPYSADVPISIRWPVTEWQLTVSGHRRNGKALLEVSRFFQNISSHSPVTDMTIDTGNLTISFLFSVECEANFYGPTCTVFCNETFRDQNGGSFKCSPDGKKLCERGWGGPLCNEPQCDERCSHGTCTAPNTCRPSYILKPLTNVGASVLPHQASRASIDREESMPIKGIVGVDSGDLDYCSNHRGVCLNGGTCIADEINSYNCNCPRGFEGRNCERLVVKKEIDCSMLSCGEGVCIMNPTPRCEYHSGETSNTTNRIDFLMSPFGYAAHWVPAEVHLREPARQHDRKVPSPPPSYENGPCCSSWTTTKCVDEATV